MSDGPGLDTGLATEAIRAWSFYKERNWGGWRSVLMALLYCLLRIAKQLKGQGMIDIVGTEKAQIDALVKHIRKQPGWLAYTSEDMARIARRRKMNMPVPWHESLRRIKAIRRCGDHDGRYLISGGHASWLFDRCPDYRRLSPVEI